MQVFGSNKYDRAAGWGWAAQGRWAERCKRRGGEGPEPKPLQCERLRRQLSHWLTTVVVGQPPPAEWAGRGRPAQTPPQRLQTVEKEGKRPERPERRMSIEEISGCCHNYASACTRESHTHDLERACASVRWCRPSLRTGRPLSSASGSKWPCLFLCERYPHPLACKLLVNPLSWTTACKAGATAPPGAW
eukprot:359590-Chlamydomonas_euryale.AAC.5